MQVVTTTRELSRSSESVCVCVCVCALTQIQAGKEFCDLSFYSVGFLKSHFRVSVGKLFKKKRLLFFSHMRAQKEENTTKHTNKRMTTTTTTENNASGEEEPPFPSSEKWTIGEPNTPYELNPDNTAKDPVAFRDALLRDEEKRPEIEKEKDLAVHLLGEDVGKFQECLKDFIGKVSSSSAAAAALSANVVLFCFASSSSSSSLRPAFVNFFLKSFQR